MINKDGTRNLRELKKELKNDTPSLSDEEIIRLWIEGNYPSDKIRGRSLELIKDQCIRENCHSTMHPIRIPKPLTKEDKLEKLRLEYPTANNERRLEIIKTAKTLNGEIVTYQCYFKENGEQCQKRQTNHWCSEDHESAWKKENYGTGMPRLKRKLTTHEMQAALKAMGKGHEKHT